MHRRVCIHCKIEPQLACCKVCHNCRKLRYKRNAEARKLRYFPFVCDNVKSWCKRRGLPYNLDAQYLEQLWEQADHRCYWLGVTIDLHQSSYHPLKATLDRLRPPLGYVRGNVVWASSLANKGRSNTTADEFGKILKSVILEAADRITASNS